MLMQPVQHHTDDGGEVACTGSESQDTVICCSPSTKTTIDENATKTAGTARRSTASEGCRHGKEPDTRVKPAPAPGPIEMDLTDEDNISVDEKVYRVIPVAIVTSFLVFTARCTSA